MNTLRTNALAALASVVSTHTVYMNAVDVREFFLNRCKDLQHEL